MANPTLNWTINKERGTISFGRLFPLTGNTYNLTIAGGTAGESYTFFVMDESGEVCLAKSVTADGVTTIAFNSEDIRNQFVKDWHEVCVFHCVCSNGSATIAESDLSVTWNPVWTEPGTGSAYSMRGPQGVGISRIEFASVDAYGNFVYDIVLTNGGRCSFSAPIGPQGIPANANYAYCETTGLWHKIKVYENRFGEKIIELEQTGTANPPSGELAVLLTGNQTINGTKTFVNKIVAQGGVDGNVTGSAATAAKLTTARSFKVTDNDGTHEQTAATAFDGSADMTLKLPAALKADITGDVTGDVTGDLTGDVTGDLTGSVTIPSGETISATGNVTIGGELDATNVKDVSVGMTLADQAKKNALSEKTFFDAFSVLAKYFDGSWRYCPESTIPEGYCGNTESSHGNTNQQDWKTIGSSGDHGQRGVFGYKTTAIGKYAFYSPYYLYKIFFPNLASVGAYAFFSPDELVSIDLPICESVGDYSFNGATSLPGVTLPKCKNVGSYAFAGSMTGGTDGSIEIRIGEQATLGTAGSYNTIGAHAFSALGTQKVGKFICPNTQVFGDYCTSDGVNSGYLGNITELDIHNAVVIGDYAFCWLNYGKTDAAHKFSLNLPECLTIGYGAFGSCSASFQLHSISGLTAPKLTTLGGMAFYRQSDFAVLNCQELTSIGADAFRYCYALNSINIPSCASIGDNAFYNCTGITTISLPSILAIGTGAFYGCSLLKDVRIPNKTISEVQNMTDYPWNLSSGCVITCSNGTITLT